MIKSYATLLAVLVIISGCGSVKVEQYQNETPKFTMESFYTGKLVAKGVLYDFNNAVIRRFNANLLGSWEGNKGTLKEVFYWNDGEKQFRTWKLEKQGDGNYTGQAGDVLGIAAGKAAGNAFHWKYGLRIVLDKETAETIDVTMDDWMYLIDENSLVNQTDMYKYNIKVGQVTLFIEKVDEFDKEETFE